MQENESPFAEGYSPLPTNDAAGSDGPTYADGNPPQASPFVATLVQPSPVLKRPRVWPSLLVAILVIPFAAIVAGAVLIVSAVVDGGPQVMQNPNLLQDWLKGFASTKVGLMVLVVPGQLIFFGTAALAAWISPERWTRRLGMRRGSLPLWCWAVFLVATPAIGLASSILLSLVVDEMSEQLQMMEAMMRAHAENFLVGLVLMVACVPGVVEELLFRGYLQSRLSKSWHPAAAILVSATIFSCAHLDPLHVLGVVPLGIWLGLVAWRSGSVFPAMLCHIANNAVAVIGVKYQDASTLELTLDSFTTGTLIICVPALLLSLGIIFFSRE